MFLIVCQLGEVPTLQKSFLVAVVTMVTVFTLATIVAGKIWLALAISVEKRIGPVMAVVPFMEFLEMTVRFVPPANDHIPAFTTVSVATTWCFEAVWRRTTRLVPQALEVHTLFGKLALNPRKPKSNKIKKTSYLKGHLLFLKNSKYGD